jgi:Flp pilus assembly pilin Flp
MSTRTPLLRRWLSRLGREESGQAATEYALFNFFILIGAFGGLLGFLPAALKAYEIYVKGFYYVLSMPFP